MQIRIGNKQDEQTVRELAVILSGGKLNLEGTDADLRKIETHYFSHDGVFFVAEEEREVFAFAAALKQSETACELKRLYVREDKRAAGVGRMLLKQVVSFARSLDYDLLAVRLDGLPPGGQEFLEHCGFELNQAQLELSLHRR